MISAKDYETILNSFCFFSNYIGLHSPDAATPPRFAIQQWSKYEETISRQPRTNNSSEGNYFSVAFVNTNY